MDIEPEDVRDYALLAVASLLFVVVLGVVGLQFGETAEGGIALSPTGAQVLVGVIVAFVLVLGAAGIAVGRRR
jgi:hypothetical protein